LLVSSEVM